MSSQTAGLDDQMSVRNPVDGPRPEASVPFLGSRRRRREKIERTRSETREKTGHARESSSGLCSARPRDGIIRVGGRSVPEIRAGIRSVVLSRRARATP